MGSTGASNQSGKDHIDDSRNNYDDSLSCFQKTVVLYDWWLVKAEKDFEGKWLAVAGNTSRVQQALRVFTSASIVKRYDVFSLETADGIYVFVKGFINKLRTRENGFSSEIFDHFVFGFPPHWECCAVNCYDKEFGTGSVSRKNADSNGLAKDPGSNLCKSIRKSSPRFMQSFLQSKTSGNPEKLFCKVGGDVSQEETGCTNVSHSSSGRRRSSRLRYVQVSQEKNPASGDTVEIGEKEQSTTSEACWNQNGQKLESVPSATIQPGLRNGPDSYGLAAEPGSVTKSSPRSIQSFLQSEKSCNPHKLFFEVGGDASEEETGCANVSYSSSGHRRSSRLRYVQASQEKNPASGDPVEIEKKDQNTTSDTCWNQNCQKMESGPSATTQPVSRKGIRKSSPQRETAGNPGKLFSEVGGNVSQEKNGCSNISCSSGHRRSSRLRYMQVNWEKNPASGDPVEIGKKEHSTTSEACWNQNGEKLDENIRHSVVKDKAITTEESSSVKTTKRRINFDTSESSSVKTTKRKINVDTRASSIKKEGKEKICTVSPESLSFRKSRSGRLLIPALEFWRNEMPVYDAEHKITGIQDGLHFVSPLRGSLC
ncbi:hypothetical protein O6P43_010407 [Quillaja saponaria]|uniref:SANTA domain-containing protein n=1 Tax=Quillaja saponaria TaxID=32244 RepID=A0AAD7VEF8_QUISA|nr:hypothetical protein O6P43_010407 [Quillaja saponaria]